MVCPTVMLVESDAAKRKRNKSIRAAMENATAILTELFMFASWPNVQSSGTRGG